MPKRKLIKFSNYSLCITVPKNAVSALNLKKGDQVDIDLLKKSNQIVISVPKKVREKEVVKESNSLRW